ncbi:hypothetical protein, partial [Escherichia coli]|uniref:hypothetical protein n=1 Tax=Escherichia coli TaxID=562 RepID=UPI003D055417
STVCLYMQTPSPTSNGAAYSVLIAVSWGVGGRRFKSSRADQKSQKKPTVKVGFFISAFNSINKP